MLWDELERVEGLKQTNENEGHLVIGELYEGSEPRSTERQGRTHLLSKADTRSSVEWQEDERLRGEVFLETVVQETIWVEFVGYCMYVRSSR